MEIRECLAIVHQWDYDLPAGIGAAIAAKDFNHEGQTYWQVMAPLMMNLQELQSLAAAT